MSEIEIIPTVVPSSLADVERAVAMYSPFAGMLHVDFADGRFAPNTTWMPEGRMQIRGMEWEAHLMVQEAEPLGLACVRAGASRVIGHVEATDGHSLEVLSSWKAAGAKEVGLGLLYQTPPEKLDPFVGACDVVQVMTIERIGVQGLPFAAGASERVRQIHARHPEALISVDGGVNEMTLPQLARAGASRFCAGSALSKSADPEATYRALRALALRAGKAI